MSSPRYATVVFDCDSTLSRIEGIDELCRRLPLERQEEVVALTKAAMDGELPLAAVYGRRLDIVRPSRGDLEALGRHYAREAVDGANDVVAALQARGVRVVVVSGGLGPAVTAFAAALGIRGADVFAVDVYFGADGAYAGFDEDSPLARNQGKVDVLSRLEAEGGPVLFIGDGITDLEAAPVVDTFIGYGGVVRRPVIEAQAAIYRTDPDLRFVLDLMA